MKRIIIIVVFLLASSSYTCAQGKFWKTLKNVAGSLGGAVMNEYLQQSGYSEQDSRQIVSTVASAIGADTRNVNRGMDFMDADKQNRANIIADVVLEETGNLTGRQDITSKIQQGVDAGFAVSSADNNYDKANIIAGVALDAIGDLAGDDAVTNKMAALVDANLTYLSDVSKAETAESLQKAADKKSQAYKDLIVDIGMELYDRKVAKEAAERQERVERMRQERETRHNLSVDSDVRVSSPENEENGQQKDGMVQGTDDDQVKIEENYGIVQHVEGNEASIYFNDGKLSGQDDGEKNVCQEVLDSQGKVLEIVEIQDESVEQGFNTDVATIIPFVRECSVSGYPFNGIELSRDSHEELGKLYNILTKYADLHIKITGHTCNVGTAAVNFRVGLERARRWKEYLVGKGINADRILLDSKGATQPVVANTSSESREANRRVEIDVLLSSEEEENIRTQVNRLIQFYSSPRTFRVQFMATSTPIKDYDSVFIVKYDIYNSKEEIGYVDGKTVYRYVSQEVRSWKEAIALREEFAERGFNVWIVEYRGGVRVPL